MKRSDMAKGVFVVCLFVMLAVWSIEDWVGTRLDRDRLAILLTIAASCGAAWLTPRKSANGEQER